MSDEHSWGAFDHDPGDHHDPDFNPGLADSPDPSDPSVSPVFPVDDHGGFDDHGYEPPAFTEHHTDAGAAEPAWEHDDPAPPEHPYAEITASHTLGPIGADPDATDPAETLSVFPPTVDVGALPEPVDGFPWIDTGSLGIAGPAALAVPADPITPADLADYAAEDLPPAADPWATLAASEDPATSTLARWWHPGTE